MNDKKLTSLDSQIKEASQVSNANENLGKEIAPNKSAADLVYLTKERKSISEKLSQCRLFSIRAKEALEVYESTLSKIKKEKILERGEPFWVNAESLISQNLILTNLPLTIFNVPQQILYAKNLYVIFGASFLLAALIFYKSFSKTQKYNMKFVLKI